MISVRGRSCSHTTLRPLPPKKKIIFLSFAISSNFRCVSGVKKKTFLPLTFINSLFILKPVWRLGYVIANIFLSGTLNIPISNWLSFPLPAWLSNVHSPVRPMINPMIGRRKKDELFIPVHVYFCKSEFEQRIPNSHSVLVFTNRRTHQCLFI